MIFLGTCSNKEISKIAESCNRRLNKQKFNKKVKEEYPDMYYALALNMYNPFNYYQNKKYYNLVHSSIDYVFLKTEEDRWVN